MPHPNEAVETFPMESREGEVPPARSQDNWAQQGQAPVGTFRKKPTQIRTTTICLFCLCPGMMLQHFQHCTSEFDAPKNLQLFYRHG